ncbi:hypothetical protein BKG89_07655 [Rodentibacter caecimuris]|uniref:HTH cro/C1-type domain-containing protein n=1 Tax=Rodentibacter caecimuris TaxID=1796644 RepID=A0ABX3KVP0_9PAST|nr:hypothetical protein BKG89_07655 [Rodentibacter heylii]
MAKIKIDDPSFAERMKFIVETRFKNNNSELARAVGVAVTSLNRWLSGEADPSRSNLVKIAKVANVSLEWLATGNIIDANQTKPSSFTYLDKLRYSISLLNELLESEEMLALTLSEEKVLNSTELTLIQNYRNCSEEVQLTISTTASTMAKKSYI